MVIKGDLRLKINVNPGLIVDEVMKPGLYDAYTNALISLQQSQPRAIATPNSHLRYIPNTLMIIF